MTNLNLIATFTGKNWSVHAPDLPGVAATAATCYEAIQLYREALVFHIEGLTPAERALLPYFDLSRVDTFVVVPQDKLGAWRKHVGLTQGDVARALGIPQPRVSEMERDPRSVSFERVQGYLLEVAKHAGMPAPPSIIDAA